MNKSMQMTISKKSTEKFFYKTLLHIGIGIIGFVLVYNLYSINMISFLVIVFFISLIIKGLFHSLEINYCKQENICTIEIKNNILHFTQKEFFLEDSYLFFRLEACSTNAAVSLHQEKDAKIITIFQKVIFNPLEFQEFLKLIQPYRKFDVFPWKKNMTYGTLYVCKHGFIVGGREFFYHEVEKFEWGTEIYYKRLARFERATMYIDLKNGEKIIETYQDSAGLTNARIFYIWLYVHKKEIAKATGYKKITRPFNQILEALEKEGCESL